MATASLLPTFYKRTWHVVELRLKQTHNMACSNHQPPPK